MTHQEFLDLLEDRFDAGKAQFLGLISELPKEAFLAQASAAWLRHELATGKSMNFAAAQAAIEGVIYCCLDSD